MARKKKDDNAPGAPAWMVTYSDMVTLLLTFFVLLLSMATMDNMKFQEALGSLKGAFGHFSTSGKTEIDRPHISSFAPMDDDLVTRVYQRVQAQISRLRLDKDIELVKDRGAVVLRIKDSVLFDLNSTTLKPGSYPILRKVAQLVRPLPLTLRVEGHTDDMPSHDPARSNWDISVERAVSTVKFFAHEKLLPVRRLAAIGYGAEHPLVPNDSPQQRALNRRVDFVLESTGYYRDQLPYLIEANDQLPF